MECYDTFGRVCKITKPSGAFTKTTYNLAGQVTGQFVGTDEGSTSVLSDDTIIEQTLFSYDATTGQNWLTQKFQRNDNDTSSTNVLTTSNTRDDLEDGGASQFVATIRAVRQAPDRSSVEVLVPDFQGRAESIKTVISAGCDVFGHNIETASRLYAHVRPQADYRRSLDVLSQAKRLAGGRGHPTLIKNGMMVGLGERDDEVVQVMRDLRSASCDVLTIGQYLCPSDRQLPVARFVHPAQFERWKSQALAMGFAFVAAGPFVRSSYLAHEALAAASGPEPV